jgi:hypothetical protein
MAIPALENLQRLWRAQDNLIPWAASIISEVDHLKDHLDGIEVYLSCVKSTQETGIKTERHTALCGLFIRTFDAITNALRAYMSGNYTGCVMYLRDALETHFLLSYLLEEDGRPEEWLRSDYEAIRKKYAPVEIRKALDERDGFKEKKREKHYKLLSILGAYPSPQAFELKRDGTRSINVGPFKQKDLVRECIEECAKVSLLLSSDLYLYISDLPSIKTAFSAPSLRLQKTREMYYSSSDGKQSGL